MRIPRTDQSSSRKPLPSRSRRPHAPHRWLRAIGVSPSPLVPACWYFSVGGVERSHRQPSEGGARRHVLRYRRECESDGGRGNHRLYVEPVDFFQQPRGQIGVAHRFDARPAYVPGARLGHVSESPLRAQLEGPRDREGRKDQQESKQVAGEIALIEQEGGKRAQ